MKSDRELLESLLAAAEANAGRSEELLRRPDDVYTTGWFMCVPKCFNESLDIRLTPRVGKGMIWTQGTTFTFRTGDTLYDNAGGYQVWSEALKQFRLMVQVIESAEVTPPNKTDNRPRFPGTVRFNIFRPNQDKTGLEPLGNHAMSQDDFVRFLISGPSGALAQQLSGHQ